MTADADGHINGATTVPDLAAGTYLVTAYDSSGMHYSTAFVVTGGGSSSASPSPSSSPIVNPKFTLSPTSGAVGSTVTITGTGFSPKEPATLIVNNQMFSQSLTADDDGKISGTGIVPNLPAGTYNVVAHDASGMSYSTAFVVTVGSSSSPSPSASPTATPTPTPTQNPNRPSPDLSFYCISSTTSSGFNVQIQGSITYNGHGLPSAGIQLFDSVSGGATWQDLTYVITGNDGAFTCTWNPSASGNYVIRAIWAGDNEYSNATATYNFAVQPLNNQDQNVFSVTSNSTLTSLTFDSATNQLSFGVSGPSGTTGLTTVCIPQSLIPDASRINVMLDGSPINYTSASEGNVWILTFTYSHSSHTIVIALGSAATATSPVATQTLTASPTATPAVPESSTWTTLPLLIASITLSIVFARKKTKKETVKRL